MRVLCLLSGPEPTRTDLERELLTRLPAALGGALRQQAYRITMVRGARTDRSAAFAAAANLHPGLWTIEDFLTSGDVGRVLAEADLVVCRPGYTTVMDLAALGRSAVYVPTPGQPEQEWLGRSLDVQQQGVCIAQDAMAQPGVLAKALSKLSTLVAAGGRLSPKPDSDSLAAWATQALSRLGRATVNTV